jgi:hypothetical protein
MSPGPLTTAHRGGINFQNGARGRFTPLPHNRGLFNAGRQRFNVTPGENGSTNVTLDEGEAIVVGTDPETGAVTIQITQPPAEPENDTLEVGPQNAAAPRRPALRALASQQRMSVATAPDGTVTITPDAGNELLVFGDPAMGEVEVVEVRPAEPVE